MTAEELLGIARATIGQVRYCVAVTASAGGLKEANARVVGPSALSDDRSVTFVTSVSSRKAAEIDAHGRLTLVYQHDPEGAYVTLGGTAALDGSPATQAAVWSPDLDRWHPNGPGGADVVVVRFRPGRVELWNYARGVMPRPEGLHAAVLARGGEDGGSNVPQA